METLRVVAHCIDDVLVKGYTDDFHPGRPFFHIFEETGETPPRQPVRLGIKEIKAVFFVKTLEGNREYKERNEFDDGDRVLGRRVEVTFIDGETIRGYTVDYHPSQQGFFLIPVDPQSNNIQIFVVAYAMRNIRFV